MRRERLKLDDENAAQVIAGVLVEVACDREHFTQLRHLWQALLKLGAGQSVEAGQVAGTRSRRKSSAVLRLLSLSSSGSPPATAMPPQRLKANAPSHTFDRNLVFDALIFILTFSIRDFTFRECGPA